MKSKEEIAFAAWLQELKEIGLVVSFTYEPVSFPLYEGFSTPHGKKKGRVRSTISYTPDFEVIWSELAIGLLTYKPGDPIKHFLVTPDCHKTFVEIKGSFKQNWDRDTVTKIAWCHDKYDINITLVKPPKLFDQTFYPEYYFKTDSGKSDRSIRINGVLVSMRDLPNYLNVNKWIEQL